MDWIETYLLVIGMSSNLWVRALDVFLDENVPAKNWHVQPYVGMCIRPTAHVSPQSDRLAVSGLLTILYLNLIGWIIWTAHCPASVSDLK